MQMDLDTRGGSSDYTGGKNTTKEYNGCANGGTGTLYFLK
jgi:hypothetical protein